MRVRSHGHTRLIGGLLLALSAIGCKTVLLDDYEASIDVTERYAGGAGERVRIGHFTRVESGEFESHCSPEHRIVAPDGESLSDYIRYAFEDELRSNGLLAPDGGVVIDAEFDAINYDARWRTWRISVALRADGDESATFEIERKIDVDLKDKLLQGGAGAYCNQAQAVFPELVRTLIERILGSDEFAELVG